MLILKAFINEKQIEEIHIQNIGHIADDYFKYKVRKPKDINMIVMHDRSRGWKPLAKQVLQQLITYEETENGK